MIEFGSFMIVAYSQHFVALWLLIQNITIIAKVPGFENEKKLEDSLHFASEQI